MILHPIQCSVKIATKQKSVTVTMEQKFLAMFYIDAGERLTAIAKELGAWENKLFPI